MKPLDVGLARETYLDVLVALLFTGFTDGGRAHREVAEAALAAERPSPPRAIDLLLDGDLGGAATVIEELDTATEAMGAEPSQYLALALAAFQGREGEAVALIEGGLKDAAVEGWGMNVFRWARALLYNGLGRYEEAVAAAREAYDHQQPIGTSTWTLPEVIGASAGVRVELARAHLLYGEWLRREHRRVNARGQLRTAHDMLTAMGVEAFADRAARELRATGANAHKRSVETAGRLTAQEAQIARLARDGLSNPEIGTRLFISRRTAEYHLAKVFSKLDISSRTQLAVALPDEAAAQPV